MIQSFRILVMLQAFLHVSCQPAGHLIPTKPGSEDLAFAEAGGRRLLITGTAPRSKRSPKTPDQSQIEVLDLDRPEEGFAIWERRPMKGFIPVGLHASRDPSDRSRSLLYVVSAGRPPERRGRVVAFRIEGNALKEDDSLTTPSSELQSSGF